MVTVVVSVVQLMFYRIVIMLTGFVLLLGTLFLHHSGNN